MNPFALAYREQQQLFVFDKTYLLGILLKVGGLATLLARFIVQFFWNPTVAMVVTLVLLVLSAYMTWSFVRESPKDWRLIPLCLIPSCFIGASLSDNSLHFDYFTAILLVQASLLIYRRILSNRILWSIILTIILYLAAGPAAILFAVCAVLPSLRIRPVDGQSRSSCRMMTTLLPVITALACGAAAHFTAAVSTWTAALTPAFHYDLDAAMPAIHWAAWIALPIVILLAQAGHILTGSVIIFLASLFFSAKISNDLDRKASLTSYKYEYYTVNEDWDGLIECCRHNEWTPFTANYLNLALAHKGILTEDLLKYDQRGVMSLCYMPEDKTVDIRLAHIMFAMGNMAAAQDVAFNSLNTLEGYNPAMVMMNARVELMRGAYKVADKYLALLEKAPHYRKWAKAHRRFLWNDEEVGLDPVLGNGRLDFPDEDGFAMFGNPVEELARIVETNPSDGKSMQYYLSFLLLAKDVNSLCRVVDRYWGSPTLQTLPVPVQEALVFYSEYSRNIEGVEPVSLEWCLYHGVTSDTAARFQAFQQASLQSKGTAPKGFRNTYWNYLIYTAI